MITASLTLGTLCILYYLFLVLHAGIFVNFGWFWAVTGGAFLLNAFLHRFPNSPGAVWAGRFLTAALAALIVLIGILCAVIVSGIHSTVPGGLDYVIVLGAQVRKTVPSRALLQRIRTAQEIAKENPEVKLILSGGQGSGEEITEARCMWNWLTENGIDEGRLILEEKSTTTQENLVFSDQLTGCSQKSCAIISNDFHLYRASKIAGKAGYQDVHTVSAGSEPLMKPHYFVREAVALLYGKLKGSF